ncbi:MAG: alpha/beta hydrolase [Gemmatimonadetes bacterium]|nr:alpha/beta hydrolase [Gemmatimonadota bacterium]
MAGPRPEARPGPGDRGSARRARRIHGRLPMRCLTIPALCLAWLATALPCPAQDRPGVPDLRHHLLQSKNVDEEYSILVSLPEGYAASERTYPVLYVLDAEKSFGLARDVVDWLSWAREMPRMIVVGISYGEGTAEWWQKRSRDLTSRQDRSKLWGEWPLAGGADAFRRFLSGELFPLIESQYRAGPDRVLVGLSFGGLFGAYDLLSPDRLFGRYLLVSPGYAWDYEAILGTESAFSAGSSALPAVVYTAIGTEDEPAVVEPWRRFNAQLEARSYAGLRFHAEEFEGETHISVFPVALAHGLKWIFLDGR